MPVMSKGLIQILIFDKMAATQKKSSVFCKRFTLQSGLKNQNFYQKSYYHHHYLKNISEKLVQKFQANQSSRFKVIFLTDADNSATRKTR